MQRAFSFQNYDDDPSYRPLPVPEDAYTDSSPPPRPPVHSNRSSFLPGGHSTEYYERQPLRDAEYSSQSQGQQQEPRYNPHPHHGHSHTRHDSTSSVSSSVSSVSQVARGLGAPSPRSQQYTDEDMYYGSRESPRRPLPAVGGASTMGGYQYQDNDRYSGGAAAHQQSPEDTLLYTQHSGLRGNSLHSTSPMSQTNVPLMGSSGGGTPASRFADPMPSPPPPPHSSSNNNYAQSPLSSNRETFGAGRNSTGIGIISGLPQPQPPPHIIGTLDNRSSDRVLNDPVGGHYTDNPYSRYSTTWDPSISSRHLQVTDAETYVFSDDEVDDVGGGYAGTAAGARAGTGTRAGAAAGASSLSSSSLAAAAAARIGRSANTPPRSTGPIPAGVGGAGGGLLSGSERGSTMMLNEKSMPSDWMQKQTHSKKKTRWVVVVIIIFVILAAAGGTTAGVLLSKKNSGSSGSGASSGGSSSGDITNGGGGGLTGSEDVAKNGDLNKDSPEIKALMANDKLHKVFHGMDYTPLNSQYPDCMQNPPTQNNITRDIAVMSLLTDKLRLYGNDCNQTEMVLHAISALDIPMKIWLGVWLDYNTTTNSRQLNHLYTILSAYPSSRFEGVAVGNEVLFREDLSENQLFTTIADVRANLTSLSINLPVGTSDLGSNWKSTMVPYVDVLMANVHPFFAGVVAEKAADWTWTFFDQNDIILTQGLTKKPRVMISEVGWPSAGGADGGSVAGISEMNRFMEDFVCQQNKNGTEYFWFSAFDEPWKVVYNTPGKEWEDKWGLMDVNRRLKDGLVIPTCV